MTILNVFQIKCTNCGRHLDNGYGGSVDGETEEEIIELAEAGGWLCNHPVENGSNWDFCTRCKRQAT